MEQSALLQFDANLTSHVFSPTSFGQHRAEFGEHPAGALDRLAHRRGRLVIAERRRQRDALTLQRAFPHALR